MRVGAAFVATALAKAGLAEISVGSAMQAPRPRSTWRRERMSCVRAAKSRSCACSCQFATVMVAWVRIFWNGADSITPINNAENVPVIVVEPLHDPVDGLHVVVLRSAAGGVGQQLGRERAVEVLRGAR